MTKKMTVMGVGKKIALPVVVYIIITGVISYLASPLFSISQKHDKTLTIVGISIAVLGFTVNMIAAVSMMKAFKEGKLVTSGLYKVFRNPMYIIQIFITLPGLLLLFNSWLSLTTILIAYMIYRIFIKEEYKYLEEKFGEEYRAYLKSVIIKL